MIDSRSHYHLLHVTLEAVSAHGVHTGRGDTTHDSLVVRDANGLPTLPGSSIAGVLRHAFTQMYDNAQANHLFGYINHTNSTGQASWLTVAWGMIHNSQNQPCEGLIKNPQNDELLCELLDSKPIVRQRVRLTEYGTAADTGKFDTTLIPAGARYTTLIGYWCDGSTDSIDCWNKFLTLLQQPYVRLGKGTRSGSGLFNIIGLHHGQWDLRTSQGQQGYSQRPRTRTSTNGLTNILSNTSGQTCSMTMQLKAESAWRIGGGERVVLNAPTTQDKEPDLLPMHEPRITWNDGVAKLKDNESYLLPASAIKGALRHRVAYHYYCLNKIFVQADIKTSTDDCEAVKVLFGYALDNKQAAAGIVAIHDVLIDSSKAKQMMHNKIDRFTGGVIDGALFSELVLWQTPITLKLDILGSPTICPNIKKALALALDDLANGWLPLGAGGSRGLGVFSDPTGQGAQWSDNGTWIQGETV
ncbi:MAG: hypothetical protein KDI39_06485 [Pseudomonadales bacterium]|nr:hypothetical protein [Pseudomonadales bacterium]